MKKLAIIGSSGGNLYNLGGKDPIKLLNEYIKQAESANIQISDILFIGAHSSMDNVNEKTTANIYTFENGEIVQGEEALLSEINKSAKIIDKKISEKINSDFIDGVIFVSADPKGINELTSRAVVSKNISVVGTGGTAMADLQSMGAKVIAVSGTTGTTNRTRAISAISSFAKEFNYKYSPIIGGSSDNKNQSMRLRDRINIRGIMMASLPGFIAMSLILALSKISFLSGLEKVFELIIDVLPIMISTIAAFQVSGLEEVGIISGIIAGVLSKEGGIIGGMIGGILAGVLAFYLINLAFKYKMPGTTANIISGGISGIISGLLVYFLFSPLANMVGEFIKNTIQLALEYNSIIAGALAGALIWPAIIGGVYHAAILPIVLLEMEKTGSSFLGAIDMVSLVMVSAGITLATVVFPIKKEDRTIALPGFLINMIFGTFVEASYPFMLSNKIIFIGSLISGALSGAVVGFFEVKGTAYVPSILGPSLSNNFIGMLIAMLVAIVLSFIFTSIGNKTVKRSVKNDKE